MVFFCPTDSSCKTTICFGFPSSVLVNYRESASAVDVDGVSFVDSLLSHHLQSPCLELAPQTQLCSPPTLTNTSKPFKTRRSLISKNLPLFWGAVLPVTFFFGWVMQLPPRASRQISAGRHRFQPEALRIEKSPWWLGYYTSGGPKNQI